MTMKYGSKLVTWLGRAGLAIVLGGCVVGADDAMTSIADSGPVPTTGASASATGETTAGEGSTGSPATTMSEETTADPDTSGGVTCDPPCAADQMCVDGSCFDIPPDATTTGEPPPPTNSDYGPCDMCAAGESPVMVGMIPGCFCSPMCDGMMCATPNEGTAQAMCVLELMMGAGPTQCALICTTTEDCPTGATCEDAGGASICVHPAP